MLDATLTNFPRQTSDHGRYLSALERSVAEFGRANSVFDLVNSGKVQMKDYHNLLISIFHQVYFSSTTFAMAGAMCSLIDVGARGYLLHHAEEEKDHWGWILEDLAATGYKGQDPRGMHAHWSSQAYLSYGVYLSMFMPLGRLAMAHSLEGISGHYGLEFGQKFLRALGLNPKQAKFFLAHGELDQGHSKEIGNVLAKCSVTPQAWGELENVVLTTSQLYKNIYNSSVVRT